MANDNRRTVTVYGATGAQGGAVARSLLKNHAFKVRAITRKPDSEAAKALRALGAEIVQGDGWSKEQMVAAFSGSWAAFVNTNSDDPCFVDGHPPTEVDLGKIIIDAIIEAGTVKHLVYSSFVDTSSFTNGQASIKAADMKAKVQRYAADSGHFDTVCPLYQGWYMGIFLRQDYARALGGFPYFQDEDGFRTLHLPRWGTHTDMPIPWISLEDDFGDIVHGIFLEPENYNRRVVPTVSDVCTYPEVMDAVHALATGQKAQYIPVTDWEAHFGDSHHGRESLTIFKFGHFTNGKYFGHEPISTDISAYLKSKAAEAQGKDPSDRKLITLSEWFEKHVAPLI
uniref:NmrA-like family domain-containing oxidoreductase notA n=1 Tax=Aspergillus sp. (strain MF297-2) TaxID=877550 RepID=NOTA_ASPSM|nr:RecName: Full=NmrA-like family domain-containing oxidoreductase notA; AltName: Full=Notoamide biosynthesis cluster protein A [Aspergillus sp. MF297-2]ADM34134.1 NmrA family protein [Aspergillus sp. MF297-2]